MLTSWPALSTSYDGDWVIRLAEGHTKRANSVTCLGSDSSDLDRRIDRTEAIFVRHGLPPVFRISPLAPKALSNTLNRRGWDTFDESLVMTLDLTADVIQDAICPSEIEAALDVTDRPDAAWLEACRRIDGLSEASLRTFSLMLRRLLPKAGYGRLSVDDDIVALALAVVDVELVGLFDVMTAKEQRRRGFSRHLLSQLLSFGHQQGATHGWLSVAALNDPAVALYRSLGFVEVYRYHYRSKM